MIGGNPDLPDPDAFSPTDPHPGSVGFCAPTPELDSLHKHCNPFILESAG